MQIISKNEDKRGNGGRTNLISTVICVERISGDVEGEFIREFGLAREFLLKLKKELGENKELVKVVEFRIIE